ncbi:translation initiation factor IF-2 [Ectothiorhodospira haloalkaliphila]|uniref:Translation initiation factor IF-2 n=2 Tax=Ectothiorhodospira haloalkaliphila TaxID=421628 RepID=W8KNJ2_9GAMM|nr:MULTISPECIES: translation initiation factor IF-2 [Ectothiorhodospira]AHK78587.1 translation initiation factor IF-2 [Ectothiorhodospira haloalkaliphila]MCG5497102.1 translation initiation factor IF-2 [Ectothiorhodospira variabilis]MCG5525454.1 translation initiation factor IF-2 [Ectothiorhodospira haloalkaliphila]
MTDVTVKQLSEMVGTPVERLLEQLSEAGVSVSDPDQMVTEEQKFKLLEHLRKAHGKSEEDGQGRRITLRRRSTTELKVAGAQGRAKTVSVEVRKRRTYVKGGATEPEQPEAPAPVAESGPPEGKPEPLPESPQPQAVEPTAEAPAKPRTEQPAEPEQAPVVEEAKTAEQEQAEAEARAAERAAEEQRQAEEAARQAEEQRKAIEAEVLKAAEQETRQQAEQQTRQAAEELARREAEVRAAAAAAAAPPAAAPAAPATPPPAGDQPRGKRRRGKEREDAGKSKREELHVSSDKRGRRGKGKGGRAAAAVTPSKHGFEKPTAPVVREVAIPETMTVGELAQKMAIKAPELIKTLMGMGVMATINQSIDQDTATLVVEEMGHIAKPMQEAEVEEELSLEVEQAGEAVLRPPVVTVMGHVDHGKTSLLDYIRLTQVAEGEAGGITQHIGAYHVPFKNRAGVTFLDTPGHAAFTSMRARGAKVTDVVVLVVAADDGVMPQTLEAIQHAQAGEVPIVVAVNKIDKPEADPERVKSELAQHNVISEEWGGETQFVHVSAKSGEGIDRLLEAIQLQAELMELKAHQHGQARGVVVESKLDKGRGAVATLLIQSGTLEKGDVILTGQEFGRVRAMFDENGKPVKSAGPSMPVEVLGLSGVPNAGDDMLVVQDERKAREVALFRQGKFRESKLATQQAAKLENLFSQMQEGAASVVNILLKADVQGSAEALRDSLEKLSTDEVKVKIVSAGVGGITESDVNLATASSAIIIGFNVRADAGARKAASDMDVDLRYYSVIYEAIDDVKQALSGLLSPEMREEIIGLAQVRDVFKSSQFGAVAGCLVIEGSVRRGNPIRVLRDNVVVYEGELESLRRFKDDVNEVKTGTECGIAVKNYNDVKPGDQIEVYHRVEVARSL